MRMQHTSITDTFLFRLAQAILPQATLLAMFGRRAPVAAAPRRPMGRRA